MSLPDDTFAFFSGFSSAILMTSVGKIQKFIDKERIASAIQALIELKRLVERFVSDQYSWELLGEISDLSDSLSI